jgi:Zn-dependent peptidase ImmA (M78 family)
MATVNLEVLIWARETAGLSLSDAAKKLGLKDSQKAGAEEKLRSLEAGSTEPSRPQLLRMAKAYRRPLLTFYLTTPPRRGDRGEDFRSLPDRSSDTEPLVDALVRDVRARQAMVRSILLDEEEAQPLPFVGSRSLDDGVGGLLASIRQQLSIDLSTLRSQGSAEAAFALLRTRVEQAGVFVLLIGNLGSHHSAIEVSAFRGFALADPIAPFIVINDQDAKSAWSFTLLHELAHLWIGATGVSGGQFEGTTERFCNDVASNFLLPSGELQLVAVTRNTSFEQAARLIGDFSDSRLISRSLVAYRLFRTGAITDTTWRELAARFRQDWLESRAAQRARAREREGGPSYYVVRRHRLGAALLRFAARHVNDGALVPTKAGKILGVRARGVAQLLSGAAAGDQAAA